MWVAAELAEGHSIADCMPPEVPGVAAVAVQLPPPPSMQYNPVALAEEEEDPEEEEVARNSVEEQTDSCSSLIVSLNGFLNLILERHERLIVSFALQMI